MEVYIQVKLKILDLFCGAGGWTVPFLEYGDYCVGVDIKECYSPYPAHFIKQDIATLDGSRFKDFDLVIGSPPCVEFSNFRYKGTHVHGLIPNPEKGMPLIEEFWRIVDEAQPRFYAMENIKALTKYYDRKPQWHFMISKGGKRCLWTNIPIPLTNQFVFRHKIGDIYGWEKHRWKRAYIPYNIAKFIADCVHKEIDK